MLVSILTDTHYGFSRASKPFHDYFEDFYKNVFFPTLDEQNIKNVIHMGDVFDNRKGIDYWSLNWSKRVVFDELKKRDITCNIIVGNHDIHFRNTNELNSVDLLLREYDNVKVFSEIAEHKIGNLDILFVPWINKENEDASFQIIQNTKCKVVMGHLELNGFSVNSSVVMEHGLDPKVFDKFEKVFSGHYHTRSNNGKIFYLGNPYEMFWSDLKDTRGFHIFDTETLNHIPVNNPYRMFYNLYYEDNDFEDLNVKEYENKIVKLIVRKKTDSKKFEKYVDKLYTSNLFQLKILENFNTQELENIEEFESEDTIKILNRYIEDSEIDLDKYKLQKIMQNIYQEACELI